MVSGTFNYGAPCSAYYKERSAILLAHAQTTNGRAHETFGWSLYDDVVVYRVLLAFLVARAGGSLTSFVFRGKLPPKQDYEHLPSIGQSDYFRGVLIWDSEI